jgi:UDP-N-acetylmuramoyl-L-alanyl-D-glutamate--2,6-diaminopimelate ligase
MNVTSLRPSSIVLNLENVLRSHVLASSNLCADSRLVNVGDVFMAYPVGANEGMSDNRAHIPSALASGAAIVLYEDSGWDEDKFPQARMSLADERCIAVRGLAEVAGELANRWYGMPSQDMRIIGITGTNGKTTVSHWVAQALGQVESTAVMGTLGVGLLGNLNATGFTTPDAPRVHRLLAELKQKQVKAVAMEVSSHALDQGRVNGVHFTTAVFTNLTQDHLDYHGDMAHYEAAKLRLFNLPGLANAVIHIGDSVGRSWLNELIKKPDLKIWVFGSESDYSLLSENVRAKCEAILVKDIAATSQGMSFKSRINNEWHDLSMPTVGEFNVQNALAVLGVLLSSGLSTAKALLALTKLHSVPGRMEIINPNDERHPLMVVDFAHTPDALKKSLEALLPIANVRGGKLVCIFGCGGNRDAGKRPLMGDIASTLANEVVITSDNPRFEEPDAIIDQIFSGVKANCKDKVLRHADRASAILSAVKRSTNKDVLLVAGKGHEVTQEIAGKKFPFSDVDHIRLAIRGGA